MTDTRELRELWLSATGAADDATVDRTGFVSLGGASLAAARFVAAVRHRFGMEVPLRMLLRDNADLATVEVFVVHGATGGDDPAPRRPVPVETDLAPNQRSLWLLSNLHPDAAAYNVVGALRMTGTLVVDVLRQAFDDVLGRHDALRASVVAGPRLHFADRAGAELTVRYTDEPLDPLVAGFVAEWAWRPIPTDTAPMLRAALLVSGDDACLTLSMHHLIADQQTLDIVLADLAAAYRARLAGTVEDRPPAPSFAAHARARAALVGTPRWNEELAWWRARLADLPDNDRLPFTPRPPNPPSLRGRAEVAAFSPADSLMIDTFARGVGRTPTTFFMAAVALVLSRWMGTDTAVLGLPVARRRTEDEQAMAGFLVETVAVPLRVGGELTVPELLDRVGAASLDATARVDVSFDAVAAALDRPHEPLRNPLFRLWFNDLTQGGRPSEWPGLVVGELPGTTTAALFDLNVYLERGDGYRLRLVHAEDTVPADVARAVLDQCRAVAHALLTAPSTAVPLAPPTLQPARPQEPAPLSPHGADAATALRTPHGSLTYRQLSDEVTAAAHRLAAAGVEAGCVVEVRARRAGGLVIALLAVWQRDAVVALVDGELPEARLADTRAALAPSHVVTIDGLGIEVTPVDPTSVRRPEISHVLFTSGTTGVPSGVLVRRDALARAFAWYRAEFRPGPDDRVALLSGLGHDPVLRDVLVPLLNGGVLIVPAPVVPADPLRLSALLAEEAVTILHATPALLGALCAAHTAAGRPPLDALRLVVSSGAPLTADLVTELRAITPAAVVNGYGATETPQLAARTSVLAVGEPVPTRLPAVLPVGTGVAGAEVSVRTPTGEVAGVGELGEIVVRGAVATGYLDGHAGGFVAPDEYRTGDLGRFDPDGLVHVAGRRDRQVGIAGFRVQLEEIETVATGLPVIRQAVAAAVRTPSGPVLELRVVPEPGPEPTVEDIRTALSAHLPASLVPTRIRLATAVKEIRPASPPRTRSRTVRWLTALAEHVLGHDVDPHQHFFDAGFTSVTLLHLHARMVAELPTAPPAVTLFRYPTIDALARALAPGDTPVARRRPGVDTSALLREAERLRAARRARG